MLTCPRTIELSEIGDSVKSYYSPRLHCPTHSLPSFLSPLLQPFSHPPPPPSASFSLISTLIKSHNSPHPHYLDSLQFPTPPPPPYSLPVFLIALTAVASLK